MAPTDDATAVKYEVRVSSVGEESRAFAEAGILVFYGPSAPEELHEFAVITEPGTLARPVEAGDVVQIDDVTLEVTGVGDRANDNIAELGHAVFKLNGLVEVELPGEISVSEQPAPDIAPGSVLRIRGV